MKDSHKGKKIDKLSLNLKFYDRSTFFGDDFPFDVKWQRQRHRNENRKNFMCLKLLHANFLQSFVDSFVAVMLCHCQLLLSNSQIFDLEYMAIWNLRKNFQCALLFSASLTVNFMLIRKEIWIFRSHHDIMIFHGS